MLKLEATGLAPAQKQSRWSKIYVNLRDAIFAHRLTPGTKLPEDELASVYDVSRTVIRSALQALAHDRLVRLEVNRGAFVAHPSQIEAREVFDMRLLIEPKAAALAAERATPADESRLRRHLDEEHAAMHERRDSDALMLSARFHVLVAEVAAHAILREIVTDLMLRSSLIIALYWSRRDTLCASHAHNPLLDAIAQNKPREAADLMAVHLADLLAGLDLTPSDAKPKRLADILG